MTRIIAISLLTILFVACNNGKKQDTSEHDEDLHAKELLQGIWLDDETDTPLMRIEGDTIYYADSQGTPVFFKIKKDTLYTFGNDTTYYKIDHQTEYAYWFHSMADNIVKLHKSEDLSDTLAFVEKTMEAIPVYTEVTKKDSIVTYDGTRYRAYVYINPSKKKVAKTTYSEDGISMENVFYDNIMHICVYEGKKSLYASDVDKQMFLSVVPIDFLEQSILSNMEFTKVDRNGFHFRATLNIPESYVSSIANLTVGFDGKLAITAVR